MNWIIVLIALISLQSISVAIDFDETNVIRGELATENAIWTPNNFAGFYYDLDDDLGNESLITKSSDSNMYGVEYQTNTQGKDFSFTAWGSYNEIGFLGKRYFAGYIEEKDPNRNIFYKNSDNPNSALESQLEEVLWDEKLERINLEKDKPFTMLKQGYEFTVKDIEKDNNKLIVELRKDGKIIPLENENYLATDDVNKLNESTFYYRKNVGVQNNLIIIAIHFCGIFNGEDKKYAVIDGIWQLNESPIKIEDDKKMDFQTEPGNKIKINSTKKNLSLSRDKHTSLFGNFNIKVTDNDSLRYYIYKELLLPGTYEIRGRVAKNDSFEWNPMSFAGFYTDINNNICTETISCHIDPTSRIMSGINPYGIVYNTRAQIKKFNFDAWGQYYVIGFIGDEYFAGYKNCTPELKTIFNKDSQDSSFIQGQIEKVLIDSNAEKLLKQGEALTLAEGYNLSIKKIDFAGNKVHLELINKSGIVVNESIVTPSIPNATLVDQTYCYNKEVGLQRSLLTIAVHFKNALAAPDSAVTTIDGVWQISETPISIANNSRYDKMTVTSVDADNMTLTMCNKGKERVSEK
jgi:S-layer protein (TIGR01567 family)